MSDLKPFPAPQFSFNPFGAARGAWYLLAVMMVFFSTKATAQDALLNASYDVSRELYREIDASRSAFRTFERRLSRSCPQGRSSSGPEAEAWADEQRKFMKYNPLWWVSGSSAAGSYGTG